MKNSIYTSFPFIMIAFGAGILVAIFFQSCPRGYRLSGTAIGEIHYNQKCSGQEKDWFVTKEYVYANCPGGPMTVQNYEFK